MIQNPVYVFPDIEHAQVVPYPQAALPPDQHREDNLRQHVNRFMGHPEGRIRVVSTEEGIAGGYKTVIVIDTPDIPLPGGGFSSRCCFTALTPPMCMSDICVGLSCLVYTVVFDFGPRIISGVFVYRF
jgi:hypothetical protein